MSCQQAYKVPHFLRFINSVSTYNMYWKYHLPASYVLYILQYKFDQYWPDSGFKLFGNIRVTTENVVQFANYCVKNIPYVWSVIQVICDWFNQILNL